MKHVAVIGAGIAGLTVASGLQAAGRAVTLFEKSRGAGGRCATRRSAAGAFDHGATGFTATTAAFLAEVRRWQDAGWVAIDEERSSMARADDPRRAFGVPSMNALAQQLSGHLSTGVRLRANAPVLALERAGAMGTAGGWRLRLADGRLDETRFDAVAVAVPAEQAAVLLSPDATLAEFMQQTRSDPCWMVMAAWSARLPVLPNYQRGSDPAGVLSLARCEDARPGRSEVDGIGCRWVLHATPAWSADHLDATPADVIAELLGAFGRQCGVDLGAPVHSAAHRWRYARVPSPRAEPFGWNAALRLGACGDAWHGGSASPARQTDGIERAWLSGRALATQMAFD